jgi:hypothetical protein
VALVKSRYSLKPGQNIHLAQEKRIVIIEHLKVLQTKLKYPYKQYQGTLIGQSTLIDLITNIKVHLHLWQYRGTFIDSNHISTEVKDQDILRVKCQSTVTKLLSCFYILGDYGVE